MARLSPYVRGPGGVVTMQNNPPMPPGASTPQSSALPAEPGLSRVIHAPFPASLVGNRPGAPVPAPGGLPGLIVRVGPPGGDAARAHLGAGHSPDALVEAAANSLVSAAMVHGQLDPARFTAWLQQRVQFLREIPNAQALFGSVEAAAHTIAAVMGQNHAAGGAQQLQRQPGQPARPAVPLNALMPMAVSAATSHNPMPRR